MKKNLITTMSLSLFIQIGHNIKNDYDVKNFLIYFTQV